MYRLSVTVICILTTLIKGGHCVKGTKNDKSNTLTKNFQVCYGLPDLVPKGVTGNLVKIESGPAAVIGDDVRLMPLYRVIGMGRRGW